MPRTFIRPMFNLQYHKRGEKESRRVGGTEKRERRKKGGRVYRPIVLHIYNLRLILLKSTTPNRLRNN